MSDAGTGFVVKATGPGLGVAWLAPASAGFHIFGPRQNAVVFGSQAEAQVAADKASQSFGAFGTIFTVESAD